MADSNGNGRVHSRESNKARDLGLINEALSPRTAPRVFPDPGVGSNTKPLGQAHLAEGFRLGSLALRAYAAEGRASAASEFAGFAR